VKQSNVARTRERSQRAENKRTQAFEVSIVRESSDFERVALKTTSVNEKVSSKIERVIHRANLASKRGRERESERSSDRERRDREREQAAMSKEI
jgi:hypothetical protein